MDDAALLSRLIAGEPAAWDALVTSNAQVLHAVVARTLARGRGPRPDPEDVIQGVLLRLWEDGRRRLKSFRGGARLSTWLVAVARREALDRLRAGGRRARHETAYGDEPAQRPPLPGPAEAASALEVRAHMSDALARIPARDRLLVKLVTEDGWSYRSVGRVLGVKENSVGPLLQRARSRLAEVLGEEA